MSTPSHTLKRLCLREGLDENDSSIDAKLAALLPKQKMREVIRAAIDALSAGRLQAV